MTAGLDALDGVIEALARVEALEAKVAALSRALCAVGEAARMPSLGKELRSPRHLHVVETEASQ